VPTRAGVAVVGVGAEPDLWGALSAVSGEACEPDLAPVVVVAPAAPDPTP